MYYGKPAGGPVMNETQGAILNQNRPIIVHNTLAPKFETKPVAMTCQFCQRPVNTLVHKSCNCCTVLLCIFTGLFIWILIQCCRSKPITCCDAEHTCPNCGKTLGHFDSC